jgi:prepilin-type N-terminal cleavage/methylation domain-containing protein
LLNRFGSKKSFGDIKGVKMFKRLKKKEGFSLIEVMMSLLVFAIGMLMLVPMVVLSIQGNEYASKSTYASQLAQAKIEELKNRNLISTSEDIVSGMTREWIVEDVGSNLKKLTVRVTWLDQDNDEHQVEIITYKSVA